MPSINIRLKPSLHQKWSDHCKSKSLGLSELPKLFIETELRNGKSLETYEMDRETGPKQKQVQLHLLVDPGIADGIKQAASDLSWSQSKVVSKVMQCFFRKRELLADSDRLMLNKSVDAARSLMDSIEEWTDVVTRQEGISGTSNADKLHDSSAAMRQTLEDHCAKFEQFILDQDSNWRLK